mmetsp:Transcript_7507/g.10019  ORF Transcript_7507/g.10019 Transcript_7507/m.10019 type:complete len:323 (-) Transcript_7507:79-1047(-)
MEGGICLWQLVLFFSVAILVLASTGEGAKNSGSTSSRSLADKQLQNTRRRILQEWKTVKRNGLALDLKKPACSSQRSESLSESKNEGDAKRIEEIRLAPLPKNMFHWHFTFKGAPGSPYESGIYHGQVILPSNYPNAPPRVQMLTPSGRFQVHHDICLSASAYHPETWQPTWTVTTLVTALRTHMLSDPHEIGGIATSAETKRRLALTSQSYRCRSCGTNHATVFNPPQKEATASDSGTSADAKAKKLSFDDQMRKMDYETEFQQEIAALIAKRRSSNISLFQLLSASIGKLLQLTVLNKRFWVVLGFFIFVRINASVVSSF